MTVPTVALIVLILAVCYMAYVINRQLAQIVTLTNVVGSNSRHHAAIEAGLISGILNKAQLTDPLPALDARKWAALQTLYDTPDMMPYNLPAQVTTDHDDRPAVYWKRTSVNEFEAYELVRLWLAGVL